MLVYSNYTRAYAFYKPKKIPPDCKSPEGRLCLLLFDWLLDIRDISRLVFVVPADKDKLRRRLVVLGLGRISLLAQLRSLVHMM